MADSSLPADLILEIGEKDPDSISATVLTELPGQQTVDFGPCGPKGSDLMCNIDNFNKSKHEVQIWDMNLLHNDWCDFETWNGDYQFQGWMSSNGMNGAGLGHMQFIPDRQDEKYVIEFVVRRYTNGGSTGSFMNYVDMDIPISATQEEPYMGIDECATTKGKTLYLYPGPNTSNYNSSRQVYVFDIAEGDGPYLYCRATGAKNLYEHISELTGNGTGGWNKRDVLDYFQSMRGVISPYIHSACITYSANLDVMHYDYNGHQNTRVCSWVDKLNTNGPNPYKSETPGYQKRGYIGHRQTWPGNSFANWLQAKVSSCNNAQIHAIAPAFLPAQPAYIQNGWDVYTTPYLSAGVSNGTLEECILGINGAWGTDNEAWLNAPYNASWTGKEDVSNYSVYNVNGAGPAWGAMSEVSYDGNIMNRMYFLITKKDNGISTSQCDITSLRRKHSDMTLDSSTGSIFVPSVEEMTVYNWHYLEVLDRAEMPVALNFFSQDLKEVTKRTGGFSKTFELPASNYNQKKLDVLTGVGSERATEAIVWKKARIRSNGVVVFGGFARIEYVSTGDGGKYSCHILEDPTAWPELIGDLKLCELTFDTHEKNWANIEASWGETVDTLDYVYALASYGDWDSGNNVEHSLNDWHPSVYAKSVVEKIFSSIGYRVNSNFFESPEFKTLVIPYTSGEDYAPLGDIVGESGIHFAHGSFMSKHKWYTADDCSCNLLGNCSGLRRRFMPDLNEVSDVGNNYTPTFPGSPGSDNFSGGAGYTVPFTGRYVVKLTGEMYVKSGGAGKTGINFIYNGQVAQTSGNAWGSASASSSIVHGRGNYVYSGGDNPWDPENDGIHHGAPHNATGSGACHFWNGDTGEDDWLNIGFEMELDAFTGDQFAYAFYTHNWACWYNMYCYCRNLEFIVYPAPNQTGAIPASTANPGAVLPCIKQKEFLKGLTDLFNLHWTSDDDSKQIWVEPYDDFYGSGNVQDWTKKLDKTDWKDKFLIDELAKNIVFQYKVDSSDDLVKKIDADYAGTSNAPLWSYHLQPNQDMYRKGETEMGTKVFSPTMHLHSSNAFGSPVNTGDYTWTYNAATQDGPIIPCFWQADAYWGWFNGPNRPDTSYKFNIRIQNYYGMRDCPQWKQFDENAVTHTYSEYPYMGTFDKDGLHNQGGVVDTKSLAWKDVYLDPSGGNAPSFGLFTKYYSRVLDKINGGVCLRTCKMWLGQNDIANFDYRDIIHLRIDGVSTYWTINKIKDYKPGRNELTTVELVEWKYGINEKQFVKPQVFQGVRGTGGDGGATADPGGSGITYTPIDPVLIDNAVLQPALPNDTIASTNFYPNSVLMDPLKPAMDVDENLYFLPSKWDKNVINKPIKDRAVSMNVSKHNGFTMPNASGNQVKKNGIAMGYGLTASKNQMVIGSHNKHNEKALFQIGGGYVDERGRVVEKNILSVDKDGLTMYGGEIVVDLKAADVTFTQDVYYKDKNGNTKKLYLKEKPKRKAHSSEESIGEDI